MTPRPPRALSTQKNVPVFLAYCSENLRMASRLFSLGSGARMPSAQKKKAQHGARAGGRGAARESRRRSTAGGRGGRHTEASRVGEPSSLREHPSRTSGCSDHSRPARRGPPRGALQRAVLHRPHNNKTQHVHERLKAALNTTQDTSLCRRLSSVRYVGNQVRDFAPPFWFWKILGYSSGNPEKKIVAPPIPSSCASSWSC